MCIIESVCGGQRGTPFSPSTIWILGIESSSPNLVTKSLYLLNHLTSPYFAFILFYFVYTLNKHTTLKECQFWFAYLLAFC